MRKNLFSLVASLAIFYSVNAQTKISFEASEGYTTGNINGQKNWSSWSYADAPPANYFTVANGDASDGTRALRLISNESVGEVTGVERAISTFSKTRISFDIKVDALEGSDSFVSFYDADYAELFTIDFDYDGNVAVGQFWTEDEYSYSNLDAIGTYTAGVWKKVKAEFDFSNHVASLYLDNAFLGNVTFDSSFTKADIIDVFHDDFGTGFKVDNLLIEDATLATYEVSKKDIFRVYPNPTVDVVNFDVAGKINSVEVYDAAGKLVKTAKDGAKSLNVSALSEGSYVVKVQTENGAHTQKLIKK